MIEASPFWSLRRCDLVTAATPLLLWTTDESQVLGPTFRGCLAGPAGCLLVAVGRWQGVSATVETLGVSRSAVFARPPAPAGVAAVVGGA
jgi:hypothetical protein